MCILLLWKTLAVESNGDVVSDKGHPLADDSAKCTKFVEF
jgi:hypothetical protein